MWPIIKITPQIYLPTYFLFISLAFSIAIYWIAKRTWNSKMEIKTAMDMCLLIMIGSLVGSRLFHVFYELPELYLNSPIQILYLWQGGFVFYGGVLGALSLIWIYARIKKVSLLNWLNVFSAPMALAYIIGRFATLLSGSGFGRPTSMPWGISYPVGTEAPAGVSLHPTPIYAMLWELIVLILLLSLEKKGQIAKGTLFFILMIGHAIGRFILEQFRDDYRGAQLFSLSVSSWFSLLMLLLGLFLWRTQGFKVFKS